MIIASYGGGTNSTAMLIECVNRGIDVDLILFADTGGEKPLTYQYVKTFSKWLVDNGMPEITIVKKAGNGETLEENCIRMKSLPSIAYGFKTCSQKYKVQPQDKYCNNWQPAKELWKSGQKITKLIGFDADESHRAREWEDEKYINQYPLVEWDMGRDECIKTISEAGLCPPGKSACYFCPSSKPSEIRQLAKNNPELMARAIAMEENASLTAIKGLGRRFSWKDVIAQGSLFDDGYDSTPELVCGCYDG